MGCGNIEKLNTKELKENPLKLGEEKRLIFSLVKEFNGKYGKSGIAKILKGSKSLKDNEHNKSAILSCYWEKLGHKTNDFIKSQIDEMIDENILNIKKISFARPVLIINPDYEEIIPLELNKNDLNLDDIENPELLKVFQLFKEHKNIFITGHAGCGKSYILKKLKEKIPNLVVTATTGIAAVNIKGQTLHSWAGIGICNKSVEDTIKKINTKSAIKKQIQKCECLALDEISMLDIKTFEYADNVLRQIRNNDLPFGGIQVIFIGDFYQLPPVEQNSQKQYCFESELWKKLDLHTVLLTKNFRQNEKNLINALSNMRTNSLTPSDIKLLKSRENDCNSENQDILHIFATNFEADNYNTKRFQSINSPEYRLFATDGLYKGKKFTITPTNSKDENILKRIDMVCNAEKCISLKIGARVMLLINLDFEKGLINGSCGNVEAISEESISVRFDNNIIADIERHDFEFYNNEELIAARKQFPLRLAYGITIHKSQGMSLDKVFVDCSRIFEKGQLYVALSRIKTLKGLYLRNFNPSKVMVEDRVVEFYKSLKIENANYAKNLIHSHSSIQPKKSFEIIC
ncbi:AAA family ATPase [bacterium]|nr:AAA family ATPase [bacterium]